MILLFFRNVNSLIFPASAFLIVDCITQIHRIKCYSGNYRPSHDKTKPIFSHVGLIIIEVIGINRYFYFDELVFSTHCLLLIMVCFS